MARLLQLHFVMYQTQNHTSHSPGSVKCACGHTMRRHVLGICTVATCSYVREEKPRPEAAGLLCPRCSLNGPARYRIQTDEMDIMVCEWCAEFAERIGLPVQSSAAT